MGLTVSQWATALAPYNGLGDTTMRSQRPTQASEDPHELWFSNFALVEFIEAAGRTRSG